MISLIFPHKDTPQNTAILELKKQMLRENSKYPYDLSYIVGMDKDIVYPALNWLISNAKYDYVLWDSSDIVYAPGWDLLIKKYIDQFDWLSFRLIECGQIGVAQANIERNFGITAQSFNREAFERFCVEEAKKHPEIEEGFTWYSPSIFKKEWLIKMGLFNTDKPFPHPNDSEFKDKVSKLGCKFGIINAYAYHFQMAGENQGEKPERKA